MAGTPFQSLLINLTILAHKLYLRKVAIWVSLQEIFNRVKGSVIERTISNLLTFLLCKPLYALTHLPDTELGNSG